VRSFTAILALAAFLITGGLGYGSHLIICTQADGRVQVETPLTRCCNDSDKPADAPTEHNCDSCTDQIIASGHGEIVRVRTANSVTEEGLFAPMLAVVLAFVPANELASFRPLATSPPELAPAHAPIQTVVLRC
jgi:hypothetical protein